MVRQVLTVWPVLHTVVIVIEHHSFVDKTALLRRPSSTIRPRAVQEILPVCSLQLVLQPFSFMCECTRVDPNGDLRYYQYVNTCHP